MSNVTLDYRVYLYLLRLDHPETSDAIRDAFFLSKKDDVRDALSLLVTRKVVRTLYDPTRRVHVYFVD